MPSKFMMSVGAQVVSDLSGDVQQVSSLTREDSHSAPEATPVLP